MKIKNALIIVLGMLCLNAVVVLGNDPSSPKKLAATGKPNILFIAIDDMNDWTGFLGGHPQAKTPNLDRLARAGVNFTNAHCPSPGCSPSRNALLYGVEPFHSGLYPFYDHENIPTEVLDRYISLPRFFKERGYRTYGAGKIHHGSKDAPEEWNDYLEMIWNNLTYKPEAGYQAKKSKKMAFCPTANPLEEHHDYKVASYGIEVLSQQHDQPFFLAVGIVRPHLPFVCPEQFFDALPKNISSPSIKADDHDDIPWPGRAMSKIGDDFQFSKDKAWERVRRAYLACISWADYNVGRVLDSLEKSPYADNTIVVVWSDHGYHLGEKRSFKKFTLWEEATRVPFIIHDRREENAAEGRTCTQPVSLINIYRTLAELSGLEAPDYVDGSSLVPQLKAPSTPTKRPAITTWGRGNYALRSEHWRYIRYFDGSEEFYWHQKDPDEWKNLANDPKYKKQKADMISFLPKKEIPLVQEGVNLWSLVGADKPDMDKTKKHWDSMRKKMKPPLAE